MIRHHSLPGHKDRLLCVAFTPDGHHLITGSFDKTVKVWATSSWRERLTLSGHTDAVWCVAVSPDSATLATGGGAWGCPGEVKIWSIATGQEIGNVGGFEGTVWSLAYSPDGKLLAAGCSNGRVHIWETKAGLAKSKFKSSFGSVQPPSTLQAHETGVRCVAFSRDGMTFATGSVSGTVRTWSTVSWQRSGAFTAHNGDVRAIEFSADSRMIASGGSDRVVRIWSPFTRSRIASLKSHTGEVKAVAFSPNGLILASAGDDKLIKLWEVNSWHERATLTGHSGQIAALAIAPNGRQLVSCGWDQVAKVWDLAEFADQAVVATASTAKAQSQSAAKAQANFKSAVIPSAPAQAISLPKAAVILSARKDGSSGKMPCVTAPAPAELPNDRGSAAATPTLGAMTDTSMNRKLEAVLDAANAAPPKMEPAPAGDARAPAVPSIPGYEILSELGRGGMGVVYKARHVRMNRIAAIKVIDSRSFGNPDAVARFYREIQAIAQLSHPNIIMAYDANEANGLHYLVMEFVEGIDLAKMVQQQGPLPVDQACDFTRQAALGLQHAFERGLIHRDIKPSNLLVTWAPRPDAPAANNSSDPKPNATEPIVKILDMGLALLHQPAGPQRPQGVSGGLTQEGKLVGTPDYMAPEQWVNAHKVDIRADLYSLGCTLYYLLTGRVPFPGEEPMEKMLKHHMDPPTPIEELRPEVPAKVSAVIQTLMNKKPEDRYATPAELAAALA
jgi:serine/threonine-protein kinase